MKTLTLRQRNRHCDAMQCLSILFINFLFVCFFVIASPVNLNVETARLLVVGDHNTIRNDDRN